MFEKLMTKVKEHDYGMRKIPKRVYGQVYNINTNLDDKDNPKVVLFIRIFNELTNEEINKGNTRVSLKGAMAKFAIQNFSVSDFAIAEGFVTHNDPYLIIGDYNTKLFKVEHVETKTEIKESKAENRFEYFF